MPIEELAQLSSTPCVFDIIHVALNLPPSLIDESRPGKVLTSPSPVCARTRIKQRRSAKLSKFRIPAQSWSAKKRGTSSRFKTVPMRENKSLPRVEQKLIKARLIQLRRWKRFFSRTRGCSIFFATLREIFNEWNIYLISVPLSLQ